MRDLNKVMLIGNVTRDPELRTIPSGQSVASFGVATNRSWNDAAGELQKVAEFTDVVAWGKLAEIAGQILKKGRKIYVEGRLQTRNWEGQDGVKRYRTEVIASDLIVLDRPQGININGPETAEPVSATIAPLAGLSSESSGSERQADIAAATAEMPEPVAQAVSATPVTPLAGQAAEEIDIEDIPF